MSIDKALVGFLGAVTASVAAARAARPVPASIMENPGAFFQRLVALRGETEMKRHAEQLALHVLAECKSGRSTLDQLEARVVILTGLVCSFPPKTNQLQEELDRSRGRSPAASALLLASAVVSRAQARGRPEQARMDPSWATDMIAEGLAGIMSEPEFLAGVERAFQGAIENEPEIAEPPKATAAKPAAKTVDLRVVAAKTEARDALSAQAMEELRLACCRNNIAAADIEAVVDAKAEQLLEIQGALAAMQAEPGVTRLMETMRQDASLALAAGNLGRTADTLAAIADLLIQDNRQTLAAETFAILGRLEDARLNPHAAAKAYGNAVRVSGSAPVSTRWSYALRQGAALAGEADALGRASKSNHGPLSDAAKVYAVALQNLPAETAPELYTVAQNCLGNTLLRLGEIEGKGELYEHAASAYRVAAGTMDRTSAERDWAQVHSNLGTAFLKAGEFGDAERNYTDAASAYEAALEVLKPETSTPDWAAAEAGRGMALGRLGAIRSDLGLLERTARMVDAALASFEQRSAPAPWARLQSCLGNICADLGERIGGRHWLERAVTAYEAAQQEWTEQRSPLQWALSEANRGGAQLGLGTLTGSRRHLLLAEESLVRAERVFIGLGEAAYASAARQSLQTVRNELASQPSFATTPQGAPQVARARV